MTFTTLFCSFSQRLIKRQSGECSVISGDLSQLKMLNKAKAQTGQVKSMTIQSLLLLLKHNFCDSAKYKLQKEKKTFNRRHLTYTLMQTLQTVTSPQFHFWGCDGKLSTRLFFIYASLLMLLL